MKDLYDRLGAHGFDRSFLKASVLPDWWDDDLAATSGNRALAEAAVSKLLGFRIQHLRDPNANLPEVAVGNFRLKREKGVKVADVRPAVFVAERLAKVIVGGLAKPLTPFRRDVRPEQIRKHILGGAAGVDLASLLSFAWAAGIVVLHISPDRLPQESKKFAGVAMFCGQTPVIVLGSKKDGPPWLAFHLAHECGHLFLGHVKPGDPPLVDADLDSVDDDVPEQQADQFANVVLTGNPSPDYTNGYRLSGEKLAAEARVSGPQHGVDPGTVALVYARSNNMWGAGQNALKFLDCATGGHGAIANQLREHFDPDDVGETVARFLSCLTMICE